MKTHQMAFRILVPILLLLASFTSRAAIYDTVYVAQGQCVNVVDSISNGVFITIDSFRTIMPPSQGSVHLDSTGNTFINYCANGNAVNVDGFILYVCEHPTGGGAEVCDTIYVNAIINHTCTMNVSLVQDTFTCPGANRSFEISTINAIPPLTFLWNNGSNTYHACEASSSTPVCVTVTDSYGCTATACSTVPNIACSFNTTIDTVNNNVRFYPSTDPNLTVSSFQWIFGDNSTNSSAQYPTHIFQPGQYRVSMWVHYTNGDSCLNSQFVDLRYSCGMSMALWFDTAGASCGPSSVSLRATASGGHGYISYSWNNNWYDSLLCGIIPGTYSVTATDQYSCATSRTFTYNGFSPCNFNFTVDGVTNNVSFMSSPDSGMVPSIYYWDFGDGSNGSGFAPSHTYAQPGTYQVNMNIGYNNLYTCSYTYGVNVHDTTPACGINMIFINGPCSGPMPSMQALPTNGVPPYHFNWSNGVSDTTGVLCNIQAGTYCVTVFDNNSCTTSGCYSVQAPTTCNFTYQVDPVLNYVSFYGHGDSINNTITGYSWDLGIGTFSGSRPTALYPQSGSYGVIMTVYYSSGDSCQFGQVISVHNSTNTHCGFSYAVDSINNQVFFQSYPDTTLSLSSVAWVYGDGNVGAGDSVFHIYPNGRYLVTMYTYYTNGDSCIYSDYVTINGGGCQLQASIQYDSLGICAVGIPLTAYVVGGTGPYDYMWSDGEIGRTICGTLGANYNVTVTDMSSGCYATAFFAFGGSNCQAYFYHSIDTVNNNTIHFTDYSSYNPVTWTWDFGDGDTSNLQNPTHTYVTQGTYTVCLTTTDSGGCSSNYCETVNNVPVQDLEAFLYHGTTVTPGFPVWVDLEYYNAGTISMSGTISYRYPIGTTVTATGIVPASNDVVNRLLTFNFSGLQPYSSGDIHVELLASSTLTIGTLSEDTLWVNPIAGDILPADNVSFINDTVTGSWDPNAKEVSPKGEGTEGIVPMTTKDVAYMIHFQNTGNGIAHKVEVRDTIDNNIDLSTLEETGASHDHITQLIGNQLVVTFHNINLPDSGSNQAASQGYIMMRAKLKPSLTSGTRITNTAAIYFDFNAPVMTNTVVTTLFDKSTGVNAVQRFDFALVPNPASSMVTLRGEFTQGSTYEVINQLGQILMTGEVKANNTNLNISKLAGGVYLVKVISGEKVGIERLTIAR